MRYDTSALCDADAMLHALCGADAMGHALCNTDAMRCRELCDARATRHATGAPRLSTTGGARNMWSRDMHRCMVSVHKHDGVYECLR